MASDIERAIATERNNVEFGRTYRGVLHRALDVIEAASDLLSSREAGVHKLLAALESWSAAVNRGGQP